MERKEKLKNLIKGLHDGMSQEEARKIFIRDFGKISGDELSQAEKQLVAEGLPITEIQRLCDVHDCCAVASARDACVTGWGCGGLRRSRLARGRHGLLEGWRGGR